MGLFFFSCCYIHKHMLYTHTQIHKYLYKYNFLSCFGDNCKVCAYEVGLTTRYWITSCGPTLGEAISTALSILWLPIVLYLGMWHREVSPFPISKFVGGVLLQAFFR